MAELSFASPKEASPPGGPGEKETRGGMGGGKLGRRAKAEETLENSNFVQKPRRSVLSAQEEFPIKLPQVLSIIKAVVG